MKKWIGFVLLALLAPTYATHTAVSMFGILQTAFEQEEEDYFLLQAQVYYFENENDEHVLRLSAERGGEYKVVVVADEEVLENVDITVMDTGKVVFTEKEPSTTKAKTSFQSGGGQILIRLVAKDMPSSKGYAGVLVMKK